MLLALDESTVLRIIDCLEVIGRCKASVASFRHMFFKQTSGTACLDPMIIEAKKRERAPPNDSSRITQEGDT